MQIIHTVTDYKGIGWYQNCNAIGRIGNNSLLQKGYIGILLLYAFTILLSNKYLVKSMFEDSFFSHSPSYMHFPWIPCDNAGGGNEGTLQKERPWECPVCQQCFKWDTQLLRHQRKTSHYNPERKMRQEKRYEKVAIKLFNCALCSSSFMTSLERLEHLRWCQQDPRTKPLRDLYTSSWEKYPHQCYSHEVPVYFQSLELLQQHIKTHKKFDQEKVEKVLRTFRWKKRQGRVGLSNKEYEEISESANIKISFAALRRLFKKA